MSAEEQAACVVIIVCRRVAISGCDVNNTLIVYCRARLNVVYSARCQASAISLCQISAFGMGCGKREGRTCCVRVCQPHVSSK